ncbi:hypothetical protein [Spirosoma litoris]
MKVLLFFLLLVLPCLANAQDDRVKALANEIADQVVKSGNKNVAVATFKYKDCTTEYGKSLAEDLTGYLSVSGRSINVVNQELLKELLEQNKLTVQGVLVAKNDAAKLGQVSGINALVYGTITTHGEEVRLSVSIIKLPTLEVFGFAKSGFTLTGSIKSMLTCLQSTNPSIGVTKDPEKSATNTCSGRNTPGALISISECILNSRQLVCNLTVSNDRNDKADAAFGYNSRETYIITDTGRQYSASSINIGNSGNSAMYGNVSGYTAIYGVKVIGKITFDVEDSSIKSLQIFEMKDQGLRCANVAITGTSQR